LLELTEPARAFVPLLLQAAKGERFDVVDAMGVRLRAAQVVIEALDVGRPADEHDRVVAGAPSEPAVEAVVRVCDLDPAVEERRCITLRVSRIRSEERDSRVWPEIGDLGEQLRHTRVARAAVVVRDAVVDDEDPLEVLGVARGEA
jgi:hypothetical protein